MQNIPVTDNYSGSGYVASSKSSNTLPICLSAGLEAKFLSNHRFGFSLNPFFNYGFLAFSSETGNYTNYGGNINLKYGKKLQILLKGSYEKRNGTKSYDAAEMGVDGLTTAEYDYSVLRYGLGLKYDFVEAAMFKENLSFLKNTDANIFSYELSMAYDIFGMAFKYAPNYPIAGIVKYPNQYEINKQSFFFIGMNFRFAITKSN